MTSYTPNDLQEKAVLVNPRFALSDGTPKDSGKQFNSICDGYLLHAQKSEGEGGFSIGYQRNLVFFRLYAIVFSNLGVR